MEKLRHQYVMMWVLLLFLQVQVGLGNGQAISSPEDMTSILRRCCDAMQSYDYATFATCYDDKSILTFSEESTGFRLAGNFTGPNEIIRHYQELFSGHLLLTITDVTIMAVDVITGKGFIKTTLEMPGWKFTLASIITMSDAIIIRQEDFGDSIHFAERIDCLPDFQYGCYGIDSKYEQSSINNENKNNELMEKDMTGKGRTNKEKDMIQLVSEFLKYYDSENVEKAGDLFSKEAFVDYHAPSEYLPFGGTFIGKESIRSNFLWNIASKLDYEVKDPQIVIANENIALAVATYSEIGKTGIHETYQSQCLAVFLILNSEIIDLQVFVDSFAISKSYYCHSNQNFVCIDTTFPLSLTERIYVVSTLLVFSFALGFGYFFINVRHHTVRKRIRWT